MLVSLLRSLRRKPKAVRDRVAFGVATVATALVAVVWAASLGTQLVGVQQAAAVPEAATPARDSFEDVLADWRHELDQVAAAASSTVAASLATNTATSAVPAVPAPAPARIATYTTQQQ